MKTKHVILGIVGASTLLILILIVAIFNSYDNELSFQFLNQYEAEQKQSWATRHDTGELVGYHFKEDYDSFIEAAKSELLSQGFNDITDPNKYYERQVFEKRAFEHVRIEIRFAVIRSSPTINKSLYSWIDVEVMRTRPKFTIKNCWEYLRREYLKIKFRVMYKAIVGENITSGSRVIGAIHLTLRSTGGGNKNPAHRWRG